MAAGIVACAACPRAFAALAGSIARRFASSSLLVGACSPQTRNSPRCTPPKRLHPWAEHLFSQRVVRYLVQQASHKSTSPSGAAYKAGEPTRGK